MSSAIEFISYIAGIVDGEGYIGINTGNNCSPRFTIANTNRVMLLKIACLCIVLKPYIINKLPQIELMIEYLSECKFVRKGWGGGQSMPDELVIKRLMYAKQFKNLNKRGRK